VLADPDHFLELARRAQWDETLVDLAPDAAAWRGLDPVARDHLERLLAGFCVGEAAVAEHLAPFAARADDPVVAACFAAQMRDEARHDRFFARVAREVLTHRTAQELRGLLDPAFLALFEDRLPAVARDLRGAGGDLAPAVGLYHMVLEGVVFTAGQLALLDALERHPELPGLREGTERVLRDERWHVGFGSRCLQDAGLPEDGIAAILAEGEAAARAWSGAAGDPGRVVAMLHRRMRAVRRATAGVSR
jgi:ribonucleoside-diphosphate reductase beta chain